jgi:hypothetical protein
MGSVSNGFKLASSPEILYEDGILTFEGAEAICFLKFCEENPRSAPALRLICENAKGTPVRVWDNFKVTCLVKGIDGIVITGSNPQNKKIITAISADTNRNRFGSFVSFVQTVARSFPREEYKVFRDKLAEQTDIIVSKPAVPAL